jgi:hypothetical protein
LAGDRESPGDSEEQDRSKGIEIAKPRGSLPSKLLGRQEGIVPRTTLGEWPKIAELHREVEKLRIVNKENAVWSEAGMDPSGRVGGGKRRKTLTREVDQTHDPEWRVADEVRKRLAGKKLEHDAGLPIRGDEIQNFLDTRMGKDGEALDFGQSHRRSVEPAKQDLPAADRVCGRELNAAPCGFGGLQ